MAASGCPTTTCSPARAASRRPAARPAQRRAPSSASMRARRRSMSPPAVGQLGQARRRGGRAAAPRPGGPGGRLGGATRGGSAVTSTGGRGGRGRSTTRRRAGAVERLGQPLLEVGHPRHEGAYDGEATRPAPGARRYAEPVPRRPPPASFAGRRRRRAGARQDLDPARRSPPPARREPRTAGACGRRGAEDGLDLGRRERGSRRCAWARTSATVCTPPSSRTASTASSAAPMRHRSSARWR